MFYSKTRTINGGNRDYRKLIVGLVLLAVFIFILQYSEMDFNNSNNNNGNNHTAMSSNMNSDISGSWHAIWKEYVASTSSNNNAFKSGQSGGEWSMCVHFRLQRHLKFDIDMSNFIAFKFRPRSALDFGSGLGLYLDFQAQYFYKYDRNWNNGLQSVDINNGIFIGIEPENMISAGIYGKYSQQLILNIFDDNNQFITNTIPKMDLVTSFEVAEHIPFKYHEKLINFLVSKCSKYLIFSAARPGQGGIGHLKESMFDRKIWIKKFEEKGLIHLPNLSQLMRDLSRVSWFKTNTIIMANKNFIKNNGGINNIDKCDENCINDIINSKKEIINDSKYKLNMIRTDNIATSENDNDKKVIEENLIAVTRNIWPIYWSRFSDKKLCQ